MTQAIINFLCTRAGAILAPIFSAGLLSGVVWLGAHVPALRPWLTPDNVTAALGLGLSLVMVMINYLTTARGFKYGLQVQAALNAIGRRFGLSVEQDGVIAHVTASQATLIADTVATESRAKSGSTFEASPSVAATQDPNHKG